MRTPHDFGVYSREGPTGAMQSFLRDMGHKPSIKHTLERIDNDGPYEPGNVRWATWREQAHNRANNNHLTVDGVTKTITEWAEIVGIGRCTLAYRKKVGWSPRRIISEMPRGSK